MMSDTYHCQCSERSGELLILSAFRARELPAFYLFAA